MSTLSGGCLCGAVRYELRGPILAVTHCHCRMCQRASGAPVVTWASVAREDYAATAGVMARYQSSDRAWRGFCPTCGSQLAFEYEASPGKVYINVGALDDPAAVTPERNIWLQSRLPWQPYDEALPHFAGDAED
ncbi:MAG: GFA family protein [Alphaproteobacteria bacterium]|jgi:hypothetical protein|nr:GFA family protein [Alphaproteobacteria bacterium]